MKTDKKAYNLALAVYSHIRHEDYRHALLLINELKALVEEYVKAIEAKEKKDS